MNSSHDLMPSKLDLSANSMIRNWATDTNSNSSSTNLTLSVNKLNAIYK